MSKMRLELVQSPGGWFVSYLDVRMGPVEPKTTARRRAGLMAARILQKGIVQEVHVFDGGPEPTDVYTLEE